MHTYQTLLANLATLQQKQNASVKPKQHTPSTYSGTGTVQSVIFVWCAANPTATCKDAVARLASLGVGAGSASAGYRKYHNPKDANTQKQVDAAKATITLQ